jgi:hypothetical protein
MLRRAGVFAVFLENTYFGAAALGPILLFS